MIHPHRGSDILTKESFEKESRSNAIILMDVNWYLAPNCGGYEWARLQGFGFDLLPLKHANDKDAPDLVINRPSRFFQHRSRNFENYAFLIKPGKYVLSKTRIFVFVGTRVMYRREARRSDLIPDGEPLGGGFSVRAGEIVYLGNFWLDCHVVPKLWRYYTGHKDFEWKLEQYKTKYPYVDFKDTKYRLFETSVFGNEFIPKLNET